MTVFLSINIIKPISLWYAQSLGKVKATTNNNRSR